jgi:hypothetical protein
MKEILMNLFQRFATLCGAFISPSQVSAHQNLTLNDFAECRAFDPVPLK